MCEVGDIFFWNGVQGGLLRAWRSSFGQSAIIFTLRRMLIEKSYDVIAAPSHDMDTLGSFYELLSNRAASSPEQAKEIANFFQEKLRSIFVIKHDKKFWWPTSQLVISNDSSINSDEIFALDSLYHK